MISKLGAFLGAAVVAAAVGLTAAPGLAQKQAGGWIYIGDVMVGDKVDMGMVTDREPRPFKELQICTRRADVHFIHVSVVFANANQRELQIREFMPPGQCSRPIGLPGDNAREVRHVNVVAQKREPGGVDARVMVSGR